MIHILRAAMRSLNQSKSVRKSLRIAPHLDGPIVELLLLLLVAGRRWQILVWSQWWRLMVATLRLMLRSICSVLGGSRSCCSARIADASAGTPSGHMQRKQGVIFMIAK